MSNERVMLTYLRGCVAELPYTEQGKVAKAEERFFAAMDEISKDLGEEPAILALTIVGLSVAIVNGEKK